MLRFGAHRWPRSLATRETQLSLFRKPSIDSRPSPHIQRTYTLSKPGVVVGAITGWSALMLGELRISSTRYFSRWFDYAESHVEPWVLHSIALAHSRAESSPCHSLSGEYQALATSWPLIGSTSVVVARDLIADTMRKRWRTSIVVPSGQASTAPFKQCEASATGLYKL